MVIFAIFQTQNLIQIYTKTHQIAPFKKNFSGGHTPGPPSRGATRAASRRAIRPASGTYISPQYNPPHV